MQAKDYVAGSVKALKSALQLESAPRRIEGFDISNIQGTDPVASMVCFINGRSAKGEYRRFKIRIKETPDDFAMMAEVVNRYFTRLTEDKQEYPDLVLVDGGKGQLSSVVQTLNNRGIKNQRVVALAKRLDEVFLPEKPNPLMIPKGSASLKLLQRIRDEAHRFAVEYHRKLRKKRTIKSELDQIPGVGPKRRKFLLRHFGSVEKIKGTSLEELLQIKGLNKRVAENIYKHFHSQR